jgi:xylitol oxidase
MERNWAGNVSYEPGSVVRPTSVEELGRVIASASADRRAVRALGSRHSFNRIAYAETVIDTSGLPERFEILEDRTAVTVNGSMTYGRLVELLEPHGLAVHNLASLPHISIAGAITTGTHGSGSGNGNLATSVAALSIMTADGSIWSVSRGDIDFAGAVVSLGALGVMTSVTLDVLPAFDVAQQVFIGAPLTEAVDRFEEIFSSGYSVSVFTHWRGSADQIWVKYRAGDTSGAVPGQAATKRLHPIIDLDAEACTEQLGIAGSWADRLPHFRMDFTPSSGEEIQSEFFVDLADGPAAIQALDHLGAELGDAMMVSELRTIAADDLWLSQSYGRPSLAFHFTWQPDQAVADAAARAVGAALAELSPRPHWGKVFDPAQFDLTKFDRLADFLALVDRLDPNGTFSNQWFTDVFGSYR